MEACMTLGCIACMMDGVSCVPDDAHYIVSGGLRVGHRYSIRMCRKHLDQVNSRAFKLRYGEELAMLTATDELIDRYRTIVI